MLAQHDAVYYRIASAVPIPSTGAVTMASALPGIDWSSSWPETTSCLCWYCAHPFDTKPLPYPLKYDWKRDAFTVTGIFCSWGCVKAYDAQKPTRYYATHGDIVHVFYCRVTGKRPYRDPHDITRAPPRCVLASFGGHMSIDEFRDASRSHIVYDVVPPRMILHQEVIHAHRIEDLQRNSRVTNPNDVVDLSETLSTPSTHCEFKEKKRKPPAAKKKSLLDKIIAASKLPAETGE